MKVTVDTQEIVSDKNLVPVVHMDTTEVEGFSKILGTDVAEVHIENDEGLTAKFAVRVVVKNGRPTLIVDGYKKSGVNPVTSVSVVADWRL